MLNYISTFMFRFSVCPSPDFGNDTITLTVMKMMMMMNSSSGI